MYESLSPTFDKPPKASRRPLDVPPFSVEYGVFRSRGAEDHQEWYGCYEATLRTEKSQQNAHVRVQSFSS